MPEDGLVDGGDTAKNTCHAEKPECAVRVRAIRGPKVRTWGTRTYC